jgi:hypothetical protein
MTDAPEVRVALEDSWIPDTWQTGGRIGEIESLSVLPDDLDLPIAVRRQGMTAHRRSRTNR